MATTLIGVTTTDYTHSVQDVQTGINVESISYSSEPEFREDILDISGHVKGQAIGDDMTTLTISGETIRSGASALQGLLAGDFVSDATGDLDLAASGPAMGATNTEYVAQSADVTQTRGSLETTSVTYIARANLTVT